MFGIPEWAIGVTVIILVTSTCMVLLKLLGVQGRGSRLSRLDASEPETARHGAVLDDMQRKISELEERMDFAERLLAKQRDAERIAPPRS